MNWFKRLFGIQREGVTYKYDKIIDGEVNKHPVCIVTFKNSGGNVDLKMLVDSGADITLLPKWAGEMLNLKRTDLKYIGGIAGRIGYYINYTNAVVAGETLTIPVAWATQDTVPLLLGRQGVFDKFVITFDEKKGEISFR